ncbi:Aldo/keto reductase [Epithele typhae]|uniref:Aldo/keto reductase n=1 Tax=Epithele typhae TaxID=378194 RepID=UPI002008E960|nr:Aldo/keto reductase [Epithele typhae]KAH9926619.1 Aldo/keto reductase [Epithele typhae]
MASDTQFTLAPGTTLPRIWNGLWQLSSNAWGSAPAPRVRDAMGVHASKGFFAFADHYGPAEDLFGRFVDSLPENSTPRPFGATKWSVFRPTEAAAGRFQVTADRVAAVVGERCTRMRTDPIDLLQFFWQDYQDRSYLAAFQHLLALRAAGRIRHLGLCNFDTAHTEEICVTFAGADPCIVSNQVAFSIIDVRPLHGMHDLCARYGFKVLAHGTLCGGLLTDRWLGKPEPELYAGELNPSQRKYLDVILKAWGTWELFQRLLQLLREIANRHGPGVSIASVAMRWVLEHPFVGAIIVGARMGLSDHTDDNGRVFTFALTDADKADIEALLRLSNSGRMIMTIGDCGAEYRP